MILSGKTNTSTIKWDTSEFPLVCEPCLGSNPYIRMSKAEFDMECKICFRPFTVFRWKSDNNRFKRTEICQTCAKVKNLCQGCILDLKFGLSMELRDKYMKETINVPKDPINRDYWAYKISKNIDKMDLPYDNPENYTILERYLKSKGGNTSHSSINNTSNETKLSNNNLALNENSNEEIDKKSNFKETNESKDENNVGYNEVFKIIIEKKNRLISPDIILNLVTANDILGDINERLKLNKSIKEEKLRNELKNKLDQIDDIQLDGNVFKQEKIDNKETKNKKKKWKKKKENNVKEVNQVVDNDPLKFSKLLILNNNF
jgi:hypothetical protein